MDSGKSTLALQMDHTQSAHDRQGRRFTSMDRSGDAWITSRIGLRERAVDVDPDFDFWRYLVAELSAGARIDYLICDEVQFYQPAHIDQMARAVDELGIDAFCFGITADFRTELFPGSKRLFELADRVESMPVQPLCWCGRLGTTNARVIDGAVVVEGSQVMVGDTQSAASEVHYEVLCRRHYRERVPKGHSRATLSPEQLPLLPADE